MPLCKAYSGCGGMVHIRKLSCSCGHVFVAKHKQLLTPSSCKFKKRALETEEEALERKSLNRACVAKKRVMVCVDHKVAFKEMLHQGTELKK